MTKIFFITAWPNLIKNKVFTSLNVTGLAIGVVVCLLINVWLQRELSFDNFHPNGDIISVLIASPLAWFFMNNWLQDFAYRVQISWWVFIVAGMIAVLIALITVSMQAIKAALANPVKA